MTFDDLESEALKRPSDERAKLAYSLLLSLDDEAETETEEEIQKLWAAEAKRRYREYLEGKVELVPGDEAVRKSRAALRQSQAPGSELLDHDRLWNEEIERRCRAIDEGSARLVPAAEVFARAEAALG
jgi:hypothetical protein